MASFGVSIPDDLAAELDTIAEEWYSNRSQAIVRIFLEWRESRQDVNRLPVVMVDDRFPPAAEYLGTGPADDPDREVA